LLQELDADFNAFGAGVCGVFRARDDGVVHESAEQFVTRPAYRARRSRRPDADEDEETLGQAFFAKPLGVALHHPSVEAELVLHKIGAGAGFGAQPGGISFRCRIARQWRHPLGGHREGALTQHAL